MADANSLLTEWLLRFSEFVASREDSIDILEQKIRSLFLEDAHWRDMIVCSWDLRTLSTPRGIAEWLNERSESSKRSENRLSATNLHSFRLHLGPGTTPDADTCPPPSLAPIPFLDADSDGNVPQAAGGSFYFQMGVAGENEKIGGGRGTVHLRQEPSSGEWKAWVFLLTLEPEQMKGILAPPTPLALTPNGDPAQLTEMAEVLHRHQTPYIDEQISWRTRCENDPVIVIIGGGHAGLAMAASLKRHGLPTLLIEKWPKVGDSWRNRYKSLTLHTPSYFTSMPYMHLPIPFYPKFMPSPLFANFLHHYSEMLDLPTWTSTSFVAGSTSYDENTRRWSLQVVRNGETITLTPRHLIIAAGLVFQPNMPSVPGIADFKGRVFHSADWPKMEGIEAGRKVVVIGAGNTAADIANDNSVRGAAQVTMVQRSQTCIQSVQLLDILLSGGWPDKGGRDLLDSDLLANGSPMVMSAEVERGRVAKLDKVMDAALIDALQKKGLKLWWGEEGRGALHLVFKRGGGFWWDAGCAQRIIDGKIGVKTGVEVAGFSRDKVHFTDGSLLEADDVVFATGYRWLHSQLPDLLGNDIVKKLGQVTGLDAEGEMAGIYRPTGHSGLWFAAVPPAGARALSPLLAVQIKAVETGLSPPNHPLPPHTKLLSATLNPTAYGSPSV